MGFGGACAIINTGTVKSSK